MFAMSLPVFRDGGWFPDNLDWDDFRALVEGQPRSGVLVVEHPETARYADFQLHEMIEGREDARGMIPP